MIEVIVDEERGYSQDEKHMIAVNYRNGEQLNQLHREVAVLNEHYTNGSSANLGAFGLLDEHYHKNLPLSFDETAFKDAPWPNVDYTAESARLEGWEFMIGGGAIYSNMSQYDYTLDNPTGDTPHQNELCGYLKNLRLFIEGFDFVRMTQDTSVIKGGVPNGGKYVRVMSEPGKQYAIYMHHSRLCAPWGGWGMCYGAQPGNFQANLILDLPKDGGLDAYSSVYGQERAWVLLGIC